MPQPTRSHKKNPPKILFKNKQWQQCYESWLRATYEQSGSVESLRTYKNTTRLFFTDPARTPDTYTRAEIEAFVRRDVKHKDGDVAPASTSTQNNRLATLRSFYEYAEQYDVPYRKSVRPLLHTPNPTRGMKAIKTVHRRRDLSEDELKRLFAAIPRDTIIAKRDFALFSFYFWTARRCAEIVRLTWGDIFEVIFIENGVTRMGHMYRYSPKGHSREVFTAELPQQAWEALQEYLLAAGLWGSMSPDQPLFSRLDSARQSWQPIRPLRSATVSQILAKYVEIAGLTELPGRQVCPHSFRHTRARAQFRREHDIIKIKELLGHSSISTTQTYLIDAEDKPDTGAALLAAELGRF